MVRFYRRSPPKGFKSGNNLMWAVWPYAALSPKSTGC
ncbi:hypothetical protein ACVW17_000354 [Bradyrhizobium sp. USDA 4473]